MSKKSPFDIDINVLTLVDLGCGDGRIVLAAARARARAVCVEIDPYILEKAIRSAENAGLGGQIEFRHQDLKEYVKDSKAMASADVIVLYLTPQLNKQIGPDLMRNLKRGAKVISHAYRSNLGNPKKLGQYGFKARKTRVVFTFMRSAIRLGKGKRRD